MKKKVYEVPMMEVHRIETETHLLLQGSDYSGTGDIIDPGDEGDEPDDED